MREINATEFKAKCLAILDEVHRTGDVVTVLKRGKAVAQLVPAPILDEATYPQHTLRGKGRSHGDLLSATPAMEWEAERGRF
jgi:prevent-host-death family protein